MTKVKESKESRHARRKRERESQPKKESSKFGFFIVLICLSAVALSFLAVSHIEHKPVDEPDPIDVTTVNSRALSTSWSCPYLGSSAKNTVVIVNPLDDRSTKIRITSYTSAGEKIKSSSNALGPLSKLNVDLSTYRGSGDFVIHIESFSNPIAVFRNIELSDGFEYPPCLPFTSSKAIFPSLITERLSDSILYLANPFKEAVVVDITATLSNGSGATLVTQSDELSGVVIPANGRNVIDLQKPEVFGRYSDISMTVTSRSGFFVAEVLTSYSGAANASGETMVLPSRELKSELTHFVPGISPTKIIGTNASDKAGSISVGAFAQDGRSFLNESVSLLAGSTLSLGNPGSDFGLRTVSFLQERGGTKNKLYAAWSHASSDAVSSGDGSLLATTDKILPMYTGDTLELYNSSNKTIQVEIEIFGTKIGKKVDIAPKAYRSIAIDELPADQLSIVRVTSVQEIYSAATSPTFNRHSVGITINK